MTGNALLKEAEERIQRILLDLVEATGREIDAVQVDTRQFGNLKTEIFFEELTAARLSQGKLGTQ